ncbi:bile acid-CoA:amino acid N-acyltransferase-like [Anneissia japonica]|uniref:bile acid-CoA:amino acid N-acyltransferase-like n=1 Tax=Anneissia japonica TaxID=1529436 RepID=UPI00142553B0|nr:bile acid-CoA:amino acid N-acyltransferase-like [Anneissia japonica]
MIELIVSPPAAFIDEHQSIYINGLNRNAKITIRVFVNERGRKFESHAHFFASDGTVYLEKHPSVSGSYIGVVPMGLFTHMHPSPGQRSGIRLVKKDVTSPLEFDLTVYEGFLSKEDFYSETAKHIELAKTTLERWYMARDVERLEIKSGNIRGTLFKPKGDGQFPGIIDMFGSAGGIMEFRAALFSSYGFACLSLAFFSYKDLPNALPSVDMLYFEEAVDWLINEPYVLGHGIGVISVSTGAQTALMMTVISGPKIKACVIINGPPYHTSYGPSRLYKGKEKSSIELNLDNAYMKDDIMFLRNCFPSESPDQYRHALINLEDSVSNFLFVVGEDDQSCPSPEFASIACDHLCNHGKDNWTLLSYPRAGHLIEPPYTPLCKTSFQPNLGYISFYGGHPDEHAAAQEDSWRNILIFFKKHLDKNNMIVQRSPFLEKISVRSKL